MIFRRQHSPSTMWDQEVRPGFQTWYKWFYPLNNVIGSVAIFIKIKFRSEVTVKLINLFKCYGNSVNLKTI